MPRLITIAFSTHVDADRWLENRNFELKVAERLIAGVEARCDNLDHNDFVLIYCHEDHTLRMLAQLTSSPVVFYPDENGVTRVGCGFDPVSQHRIAVSLSILTDENFGVQEIVARHQDENKARSWLDALKCLPICPLAWIEVQTCAGLQRFFETDPIQLIEQADQYMGDVFIPPLDE